MPIERDKIEERVARLDLMIAEFRDARHRRLMKRGMALWQRAERKTEHRTVAALPRVPPTRH